LLRAQCSHTEPFINSRGLSDGNTHNKINHILINERWHSSIHDVWSFRGADCDTDHYLVVGKVRERWAV